jgi:hypothetical protein
MKTSTFRGAERYSDDRCDDHIVPASHSVASASPSSHNTTCSHFTTQAEEIIQPRGEEQFADVVWTGGVELSFVHQGGNAARREISN